MTVSSHYPQVFGHANDDEYERLSALGEEFDEGTFRRLTALRPGRDWRCLEIGAGRGVVARWLADRCPDGEVVATDLNIEFLEQSARPSLRVLRHDVTADDFTPGSYDLIFSRWVFEHLPERDRLLHKVARWLKPGGHLMLEDSVTFASQSSAHPAYRKVAEAVAYAIETVVGTDVGWARTFPEPLVSLGLQGLGMEAQVSVIGPGRPMTRFMSMTMRRLEKAMVASGQVTEAEIHQAIEQMSSDTFLDLSLTNMATWGHRPLP